MHHATGGAFNTYLTGLLWGWRKYVLQGPRAGCPEMHAHHMLSCPGASGATASAGTLRPSSDPWKQETHLSHESCPPRTEKGRDTLLTRDRNSKAKKSCRNKHLVSFLRSASAQILLRILYELKLPNICFPYPLLLLCLKGIKTACLGHFFGSQFHYSTSMCT